MLSRVGVFCFVCVTVSGDNMFSHLRICRNLESDSKQSNLYVTTEKKNYKALQKKDKI